MYSSKLPKQGEIWLVDFNRKKHKEALKIRPVVIIGNNVQNELDEQTIVALITTEKEELANVEPFELLVGATSQNGLDRKSKILPHRLQSIDKKLRLIKRLGKLEQKIWNQMWINLLVVLTGRKIVGSETIAEACPLVS